MYLKHSIARGLVARNNLPRPGDGVHDSGIRGVGVPTHALPPHRHWRVRAPVRALAGGGVMDSCQLGTIRVREKIN